MNIEKNITYKGKSYKVIIKGDPWINVDICEIIPQKTTEDDSTFFWLMFKLFNKPLPMKVIPGKEIILHTSGPRGWSSSMSTEVLIYNIKLLLDEYLLKKHSSNELIDWNGNLDENYNPENFEVLSYTDFLKENVDIIPEKKLDRPTRPTRLRTPTPRWPQRYDEPF
jgi:hypothetical protein